MTEQRYAKRRAFITGISGQDGSYLTEHLLNCGYEILGIDCVMPSWPHDQVCIRTDVHLANAEQMYRVLNEFAPDEIYHLATYHFSAEDLPEKNDVVLLETSYAIHVKATAIMLEWMVKQSSSSRFFYAASCHMFGSQSGVQTETTPLTPNCIYGITKAAGTYLCQYYRATQGVFASVGILYHHESARRPKRFVSQKIVSSAVAIKKGLQEQLVLGDMQTSLDWGYAPDYVRAMHRIMQHSAPDTFIIGTGEQHTIGEFVSYVFERLGLDYRQYVIEDFSILKKRDKGVYCGDSTKLQRETGWKPTVTFKQLAQGMVDAQL